VGIVLLEQLNVRCDQVHNWITRLQSVGVVPHWCSAG
jgi:hypothetical protein